MEYDSPVGADRMGALTRIRSLSSATGHLAPDGIVALEAATGLLKEIMVTAAMALYPHHGADYCDAMSLLRERVQERKDRIEAEEAEASEVTPKEGHEV